MSKVNILLIMLASCSYAIGLLVSTTEVLWLTALQIQSKLAHIKIGADYADLQAACAVNIAARKEKEER